MTYKIEIHSLGYEDHVLIVDAPSLTVAKRSERQAKIEWFERNAIDFDNDLVEMPFSRITKVKP